MSYNLKVALDSGAFSLRTRKHKFADTYIEKYAEFCHLHKDRLRFYVTLDVIDDTKKTWENLKYLESCGLKPLPVFHAKHDREWLFKLLDNYEYLGFGGLIHTVVRYRRFDIVNDLFQNIWNQKTGKLTHRVHGFGVSNGRLMAAYPWHTVDSTTSFTQARNGVLMIPRPVHSKGKIIGFDYIPPFLPVPITERRSMFTWHFSGMTAMYRNAVEQYLEQFGTTVSEVPSWGYEERDLANLYFVNQLAAQVQEKWSKLRGMNHDLVYYVSGKPGHHPSVFIDKTLPTLAEQTNGMKLLGYLGTFFDPAIVKTILGSTKDENQRPRSAIRIKTRSTGAVVK